MSIGKKLHYKKGRSDKFWEATARGKKLVLKFGRTGTQGSVQVVEYTSSEKAQAALIQRAAEKERKGYVPFKTAYELQQEAMAADGAPATGVAVARGASFAAAATENLKLAYEAEVLRGTLAKLEAENRRLHGLASDSDRYDRGERLAAAGVFKDFRARIDQQLYEGEHAVAKLKTEWAGHISVAKRLCETFEQLLIAAEKIQ